MYEYHDALVPTLIFVIEPPTTEINTLSLHDALPICAGGGAGLDPRRRAACRARHRASFLAADPVARGCGATGSRSEEHTSELQSHVNLVCRLLLEKKKIIVY